MRETSDIWPSEPKVDAFRRLVNFTADIVEAAATDPDVDTHKLAKAVVAASVANPGCEDTSNADRFARQHVDRVRFWHGRNRWMLWTGTHWADDQEAIIIELAKETARSIYTEAAALPLPDEQRKKLGRWAERSLNRDKLNNMLTLAQSVPALATTIDKWDSSKFDLNFLNGTVDLRTGELRAHCREGFITKVVRCEYSPGIVGPWWSNFLQETFGELADWIQKAVGYSLTGITSEKVAFLLWGVTDTGKSTFLSTLRDLFNDYSVLVQIDSLMWTRSADSNTSADLADLRGARFAITSETEEGQRLREAKLKRITQGMGSIKTVRKYENPISFPETHKLWMDCNHRPTISGSDDAIWNRVVPIPCVRQVKIGQRDPKLKDKLLGEKEAIAAWAVAGAVRWYAEGLGRPEIIVRTRNEWREGMDIIGQFLNEECVDDDPTAWVEASDLYERFTNWAKKQGFEHVMTQTHFGTRLNDRGMKKGKHPINRRTVYQGLKLVALI